AVVLSSSSRLVRKGMYRADLPALLSAIGNPVLVGGSQSELARREIEGAAAIGVGEDHQDALVIIDTLLAGA
ncbi:MAG TPA: hypothetical protein VLA26_03620, partial [Gammaproteobacteria bacterium]|nr:hypothetical protein [Gammaproteobacteria bacterium]